MLKIDDIDQFVSRQGQFCLIDWLMEQDYLPFAHYEAWRYGQRPYLDDSLSLGPDDLQQLLQQTEQHCRALGLSQEPRLYHRWAADRPTRLRASRQSDLHQALTRQWQRSSEAPQFDLFMDNGAVIAENGLCDALAGREFVAAERQLRELTRLNPQHPRLGSYQDLVNYGRHLQTSPVIAPDQLQAELQGLEQEVVPLARDHLGNGARDYLALAWRRLANSLAGQPFDPGQPQLHTGIALARIPDWLGAREQLEREAALYDSPLLLEYLARACQALQQEARALLLWCLLFDRHEAHAEQTVQKRPSASLQDLWQGFWELEDSLGEEPPLGWFSAFVLAREPGLIHHLEGVPAFRHDAPRAMAGVLRARLGGGDEIAARQQLQAVHPGLLTLCQAGR